MTTHTLNNPVPKSSHRGGVIDAKTAGWALTGATACSLVIGLAVVQYFGRVTGTPPQKLDPQALQNIQTEPLQRPVVLPSHGRGQQPTRDDLQGIDALFNLPQEQVETGRVAPRPTAGTAFLPIEVRSR